jgi:hypothetical protein
LSQLQADGNKIGKIKMMEERLRFEDDIRKVNHVLESANWTYEMGKNGEWEAWRNILLIMVSYDLIKLEKVEEMLKWDEGL